MSESKSINGGYIMLLCLVLLLGLPPVIGHFMLKPAEAAKTREAAKPSEHADASH